MYLCHEGPLSFFGFVGNPSVGNIRCSIGEETVMAGVVVERTGLTASHASKMIRSVEEKGLLVRTLGEKDKRQMYFALTDKAKEKLEDIRKHGIEIPDLLLPFFQ